MTDLAELRRVAQAATPGPWEFSNATDVRGCKGEFCAPSPYNGFMLVGPWTNDADATHIATFDPPTILALLDVVEAAKPFSDDEFAGTGGIFANIREALARLAALNEKEPD